MDLRLYPNCSIMKKIVIVVIVFFISCWDNSSSFFPENIKSVKIRKIKLYKGDFSINDSIFFTGAYYKNKPFDETNILYGHLHVGDKIVNNGDSKKFLDIVKNKGVDTIRYYVYTELLK